MRVVWRLGEGSVENVRSALPKPKRGAYTTVQTVLNRLVEGGLLFRRRAGNAFVYEPAVSEGEYLADSLADSLKRATPEAREAALASLVGSLENAELEALRAQAEEIEKRRRGRR